MNRHAYDVGRTKQVFIDWRLIEAGYGVGWGGDGPHPWEMPWGVRIAVHRPRIDKDPLVVADRPWESYINVYSTLLEDDGRYRLYYECYDDRKCSHLDGLQAMLAYSESSDGKDWKKPPVGSVTLPGATQHNIVYGLGAALGRGASGASVFKDPNGLADERYKLIHTGSEQGEPGVFGAVSGDGLTWRAIETPLIRGYRSDTQIVAEFDCEKGRYVGYFRGWSDMEHGRWSGRRTIAYAETDTFRSWPKPRTIVTADARDDPDLDFYTNAYVRWPGAADAHLMFPTVYRRGPDVMEVHLLSSRDGVNWHRASREPIIPSGEPGSGWEGGVYAGTGLVSLEPREWTLPLGPRWHTHNESRFLTNRSPDLPDQGYLCRAKWRKDGFTSLEAKTAGRCTTVPITFDGKKLKLSAWTRFGGEVRVGLVHASGDEMRESEYVEGRSIDDCDPISGDAFGHTVTWNRESDLGAHACRPVRLRFLLRRARIHAFQFV